MPEPRNAASRWEAVVETLPPAERFALRMYRWAEECEAEGRKIVPEDVFYVLAELGLHFPAGMVEADRG